MREPVKHVSAGGEHKGGSVRYELPDREWLYDQYVTQGKSANKISREFGCRANTVRRWLKVMHIELRGFLELAERHAQRMSGKGNPAYVDGTDRGASSKRCRYALWDARVSETCSWCGVSVKDERLEAHHKDHNRRNEMLENLCWLCRDCHKFETHTWRLWKQDKVDLTCEGRTMVIEFK